MALVVVEILPEGSQRPPDIVGCRVTLTLPDLALELHQGPSLITWLKIHPEVLAAIIDGVDELLRPLPAPDKRA